MIVHLLSCLDAAVPKTIPHVVQRVTIPGVHHAIGNTVAECMRHVARLAASAVEKVWLDACLFGDKLADPEPSIVHQSDDRIIALLEILRALLVARVPQAVDLVGCEPDFRPNFGIYR